MNKILTVLPFCSNDAILAEHLCDFIYLVNKRNQQGACLLVIAGDVHGELWEKVKIAAEVTFAHVGVVITPHIATGDKNQLVNRMMSTAAEHVKRTSRLPWLWLEPDAVPVVADWMDKLEEAYFSQPCRYFGPFMKLKEGQIIMSRGAIYPPDAIEDIREFLNGTVPYNIAGYGKITSMATKTRIMQEIAINSESDKVAENAVLIHSDKHGILTAKLRDEFEQAATRKRK